MKALKAIKASSAATPVALMLVLIAAGSLIPLWIVQAATVAGRLPLLSLIVAAVCTPVGIVIGVLAARSALRKSSIRALVGMTLAAGALMLAAVPWAPSLGLGATLVMTSSAAVAMAATGVARHISATGVRRARPAALCALVVGVALGVIAIAIAVASALDPALFAAGCGAGTGVLAAVFAIWLPGRRG